MTAICPSIGVTSDGKRWACNLDPNHLSYGWEWHVALADDGCWPIATWRRHGENDARYLAIGEPFDNAPEPPAKEPAHPASPAAQRARSRLNLAITHAEAAARLLMDAHQVGNAVRLNRIAIVLLGVLDRIDGS